MTDEAKRLIKDKYAFQDLVDIMALLRSPGGCPWDREQTHESIRKNFIEETYEACEAIDNHDTANLREELGDVLLQVLFHAQMEKEEGRFDIGDVIDEVCKKLVVRHPHIFGDVTAETADKVLENWEDIKIRTKGQTEGKKRLEDVPKSLPALMRGYKVVKRAEKAGADFGSPEEVAEDAEKQIDALVASENGKKEEIMGKILINLVILAKKFEIEPEECLTKAVNWYIISYEG
ncbi:MAG: nucleoside triphosphate pyrophosphohydrolase [Clostridia bacterium]|nr:nucleoside triphosphate pyrophosphohydrolase [Clostridia bacterium]MBR5768958.1 nucleoside triphosphate pyrophosphohydrolase [Clostridia bacterium]